MPTLHPLFTEILQSLGLPQSSPPESQESRIDLDISDESQQSGASTAAPKDCND